jgi:glucose/arabinose dehydrogenase
MDLRRIALCLLIVASAAPALAQTLTDPHLAVAPVLATGSLNQPTSMEFVAPNDFLVLEKATGIVRRVTNGVLSPTIALDVAVNSSSERGLLGIAVNSATPRAVFLYYTEASGGVDGNPPIANRVYRYTWNPASGHLESPQLILELPVTPGPNHNGGVPVMGSPSDGRRHGAFLYVVMAAQSQRKAPEQRSGADPTTRA